MIRANAVCLLIFPLLAVSCSPVSPTTVTTASAESSKTATSTPTDTATRTRTLFQTPTRNTTPEETPSATETQSPTASRYPGQQAAGPFFLIGEAENLSSLTFINTSGSVQWTIPSPHPKGMGFSPNQISPDWKWYAYVSRAVNMSGEYPEGGVVLHLLNLMTGENLEISNLLPKDYYSRLERQVKRNAPHYCDAVTQTCTHIPLGTLNDSLHSLDWSPDGKFLAFGAIWDGDTADIYLYDLDAGITRKLISARGCAESFYWSPDGQWLVYDDIDIYFEHVITWLTRETRWAVNREGSVKKKLPGRSEFDSWISDAEYIAYTITYQGPFTVFPTVVNVQTGYAFVNFRGSFHDVAVDPRARLMAVLDAGYCGPEEGCTDSRGVRGLLIGPVYGKLNYAPDQSNIFAMDILGLKATGNLLYPFVGGESPYSDVVGITSSGGVDVMKGTMQVSPNYWTAFFNEGHGIRIYDASNKFRYENNDRPDGKTIWDTNSLGLFSLTKDAILYWAFGTSAFEKVSSNPVGRLGRFFFIPVTNLYSLPHLRILPTRAEKPAEGTSIWTRTQYKELFQPGANRYDVTIPAYSSWRWSFSLGTTDSELFEKILAPEDVEFRINGEWIDSNMFRMTDQTAEGRFSRAWAAMLSGWRSGDKAELEIHYTLHTAVRDGNVEYPAGEYRQIISVVVE